MDHHTAAAYLGRIGMSAEVGAPSVELLRELQLRHLRTVPFENLSIHLGEPITLDEAALADKIIRRRRGGFCYELNGLFAALLEALGFRVCRMAARVFGDGELGIPFDHLSLVVHLEGERWISDVGFGRFSTYPLRLDRPEAQDDPSGTFLVVDAPHGDMDVLHDGNREYRLEIRPRTLAEFQVGCWWNQTSPASHFTRSLVCALAIEGGRITLSGNRLIRTVDGERTETQLSDDGAVLDAYLTIFGFELDRVPVIRPSTR